MGSKQLGFGDYEQATAKKRTKRERFLTEMEKVAPWKALRDLVISSLILVSHNLCTLSPCLGLPKSDPELLADSNHQFLMIRGRTTLSKERLASGNNVFDRN